MFFFTTFQHKVTYERAVSSGIINVIMTLKLTKDDQQSVSLIMVKSARGTLA